MYRSASTSDSGLVEFSFGDSAEMARALLALVLSGRKTATCSAFDMYPDKKIVEVGEQQIVLDEMGRRACIIEITAVEITKFSEVDAAFAEKEGEGDLSLAHWQASHKAYFTQTGCYKPDMLLVCEQFRLIEVF